MNLKFDAIFSSLSHIKGGIPIVKLSKRSRLGMHNSIFFGPSTTFYDIRQYDPERDPPNLIIDSLYDPDEGIVWAMKTVEEHEVVIKFFVDLSSSVVDSGVDLSKRKMLLEAIGLIGISGARYQDRVGLYGFTDKVVLNMPPRGGVFNFIHLLKALYDLLDKYDLKERKIKKRKTNFVAMLDFIAKTCDQQSLIVFISDFIDFEEVLRHPKYLRLLKYLAAKHEIIFVFIDNPLDITGMAGIGSIREENIETGEQVIISRSRKRLEEFEGEIRQQRKDMRGVLRKIGISSVVLEPGKHIKRLRKFFAIRRKLLRV